jgi:SAM-dependent methyltransferase
MFWFDKADVRALFVDKRREEHIIKTGDGRVRKIVVNPDQIADFKALPFPPATFSLVVFDPPHSFNGPGIMGKLYGKLEQGWRDEIKHGFAECFRVLCPLGTLIFKWNEHRVPISTVLSLTPERPLFGQRGNSRTRTHWIVFMKDTNL